MLTLYLLRHAKSSWEQTDISDFDRPLSARGRQAAPLMGRFMRANGHVPDLILCSPAARAKETLDLAFPNMSDDIEVRYIDGLYNFGDGTGLRHIVAREGGNCERVLVIGHNPSMERAASRLVSTSDSAAHHKMARKFPTCALAVIDFDLPAWSRLAERQGKLVAFERPRDLADADAEMAEPAD